MDEQPPQPIILTVIEVEKPTPPTPNYTLSTLCPACGTDTFKLACKVRCPKCGFMWDCSEL
jgi:rRNA maturation protein Nop10